MIPKASEAIELTKIRAQEWEDKELSSLLERVESGIRDSMTCTLRLIYKYPGGDATIVLRRLEATLKFNGYKVRYEAIGNGLASAIGITIVWGTDETTNRLE